MTATQEQTELLTIKNPKPFEQIGQIVGEYRRKTADLQNDMVMMVLTANTIAHIRNALSDDIVKGLKSVENTALGFKTDKKNGGYDIDTIRDCLVHALIRGVKVYGNEFNIIADNFYITKEGYQGMMRRDTRFSEVKIRYSVPVIDKAAGRAVVKFSATWKYSGRADAITEDEVPVKWNSYSSDDQILGKAERKARARIWAQATGEILPEGEAEGAIIDIDAEPTAETPRRRKTTLPPVAEDGAGDAGAGKEGKE